MDSSTDNIYTQTDVKSVYIYENQRWNPVTGYTNRYWSCRRPFTGVYLYDISPLLDR